MVGYFLERIIDKSYRYKKVMGFHMMNSIRGFEFRNCSKYTYTWFSEIYARLNLESDRMYGILDNSEERSKLFYMSCRIRKMSSTR